MTTRSRARSVLAAAAVVGLLLVAVAVASLAADVLRWQQRMQAADLAFATGVDRTASWAPDTLLPSGLSRAVLGLGDDVAYRRAVQRFWLSEPRAPLREFADVTRRSGAERELARLGDEDENPVRRANVLVMRGALLLEEARNTPTQRQVFVRRAIEQYRKAIELDPTNADAVYDLELSLKLLRRTGADAGGGGDSRSPLPAPGAGAATSGSGF